MIRGLLEAHGVCTGIAALFMLLLWRVRAHVNLHAVELQRERRMREELEAYARLDPSLAHGKAGVDPMEAARVLARRVCRTVAEKSAFQRVSVLLRNAEGRFLCVGSVGIDDLTVAALHAWGESVVAQERAGKLPAAAGGPLSASRSFDVRLGEWGEYDREVGSWAQTGRRERRRWRRALAAPLLAHSGRMMGAIIVCADGAGIDGPDGWNSDAGASLARALGPIETLAARLSTEMENEVLSERVLRAEKLAGLGQLAGGVAHALNNPLTAVLGFAELIAETSGETRVRKDAQTILLEAVKMKETVARLIEFWRPSTRANETVDIMRILDELSAACREKLQERGVGLEVVGAAEMPALRGSRVRLRQVMEHLLNNAAQAIAGARRREESEAGHAIRVSVSHDERAVHVIVSDTGPGFAEPGRVFDPFYTTKGPEQGAGLGLSICYGIVREHGGEISAFNLHPHGAAVVVELPVRHVVAEEPLVLAEESVGRFA